ncbi:tRNA-(ms[2]io[6]A)-hydroxylase [Shewanella sp. Choline-02u-19]|jgi:tRNA-(ms[2]io[6]A)-hydroxylase|uniref:tRNA isopentenyl-2-thiomethyl-A-37 hydroxylase MiaE n=1 Tax=unclassified Shewanella TaxID=196818 RepID=UPI000C3468EF|nr:MULTISPECIES: tRNA isopentenyl-2-thiomethyl-A-37 hydroxylase MiaE [unclassified Shewanella]PKG58114.1 tRNA-(ms[2]io[6]A)-hydroxylase [Shewanella sp. GutDb-MelDb]PKG73527.1 tRNA-(ms[2]io[6]A)-hydroxylase [Shewanella sp. GutCb]PKH53696.1 tRNA-(ms[2]io[6]A)-hydroxylase [Shewanella sp. Bg11-22]PKI28124.1 tRNA-(ms[2]io[6]A)-hydroxylase [Shewanella sp. Choline-02u-19]
MQQLLAPIYSFLKCETPDSWIEEAKKPEQLKGLLIDHCNCELKAAQTAMFLIRKYAIDKQSGQVLLNWAKPYEDFVYIKDRDTGAFLSKESKKNELLGELVARKDFAHSDDLIQKMVRLIKEEFHHFEQVLEIMHSRKIDYQNVRAGRYAKGMMKQVRTHEPATLIDKLIVGAFIEARSCERFAKLAPYLDDELKKFYISLLRSEARHYQDYLKLAQAISTTDIGDRVAHFATVEAELISSADEDFKFHSGAPVMAVGA